MGMKASSLCINKHNLSWRIIIILSVVCPALPVLAGQASAESADFAVNTIPEPAALVLLLTVFLLLRVRKNGICCIVMTGLWLAMPALQSYAAAPIVTNVTASQQALPLTDVDIYYDLIDSAGDGNYVHVGVSTNSGATYDVVALHTTGDIGSDVLPGTGKHIVWDVSEDLPYFSSSTVRVKITVDDSVPRNMVLIPAGSYDMGDTFNEGHTDELPVHSVYISSFYMDRYEVTKSMWDDVYAWALVNGYSFDNTGSGKETNHPVHYITWYDIVKWCNARSEIEERIPYYYTDSEKINIYRTGQLNLTNALVKWDADGYRLPTEAEWEKAARGGAAGHRFPWPYTDTISHSRANYLSSDNYSYDVSPTKGYHPDHYDEIRPYTSPTGAFAPNGYGLYDMAGNVHEWAWDFYSSNYYDSSSVWYDPHGPSSGNVRIIRDGSWATQAGYTRCVERGFRMPNIKGDSLGFRCVRRAE
jgi:formylglycine-generating enzyme required for sulfatase activity